MNDLLAVIFHPPSGIGPHERRVASGRRAATLDLISALRDAELEPIVVRPPSDDDPAAIADVEAIDSAAESPFHFGETLKGLIRDRKPPGLLYFGSGSGALLSARQIESLREFASGEGPAAVLNNFYSCDFAAISTPNRLLTLGLPAIDNPLGFVLADAGIPCRTMKRNAATQFDIDTPTDLLFLRVAERGGANVRELLDRTDLDHRHLPALLRLLADRTARVSFIGRLSPRTWADIESQVACRTSGLCEGRGMRAGSSTHKPFSRSTILQEGADVFFDRLAGATDGAIIDTRPLLAEPAGFPSAHDRFASDLLLPTEIEDPCWRSFTEAASASPIPVLLGGHTVVSGGLYLLAEACWKGRDLDRRLHPDPFDPDKERT